ncbi:1219_t:CDS:2, partial [Ambispora gerdemannii]
YGAKISQIQFEGIIISAFSTCGNATQRIAGVGKSEDISQLISLRISSEHY